jgi:hypothetical protein
MFLEHNGHQLALLEDAIETLLGETMKLQRYYEKQFSDEFNKSERKNKFS